MRFGLSKADIDLILSVLSDIKNLKQVVVFGSRAKGNHKKGSDIDLALKGEKINQADLKRASFKLNEELPLPYHFDLVHYESISNSELKEHVDRVGKRFES